MISIFSLIFRYYQEILLVTRSFMDW